MNSLSKLPRFALDYNDGESCGQVMVNRDQLAGEIARLVHCGFRIHDVTTWPSEADEEEQYQAYLRELAATPEASRPF